MSTYQEQMTEEIVTRVMQKLGPQPEATRIVAQEVAAVLAAAPSSLDRRRSEGPAPRARGVPPMGVTDWYRGPVTNAIDEFQGDIRDISQTTGEYFSMIIVVDISGATSQGSRFGQLRQRLKQRARTSRARGSS